ncbi:MAG TPA: zf-HC2 domain-containing protein [Pyrinomonadaceae bacterium]|nr:zf-HC2 domain-containing protein [Pyrinomonadaceae bacterium]
MTAELNKKDCMREIIAQRLKFVAASELSNAPTSSHVDEDLIAAFVEGRLTDTECKPVLSHLAACGLCRRTSAQFVQLENQIDDEISPAGDEEPGRLEALLSRLRSAVPVGGEEVVFAYENPPGEEEEKTLPDSPNNVKSG